MSLTTHLYLTPRSSGIPLLSLWAFMACSTVNFYHLQSFSSNHIFEWRDFYSLHISVLPFQQVFGLWHNLPIQSGTERIKVYLIRYAIVPLPVPSVHFSRKHFMFHPYLSLFKWMFICISHSADSVEPWYMVFPHLPGCKMTSNLRWAPTKHHTYMEKDMHNVLMACILM